MAEKKDMQLNSNEFSSNLERFDKKREEIENLLNKISLSMNKINGYNEIWNSDTQKVVYDDFKTVERRFVNINTEFSKYSAFLRNVLDKHDTEEQTQATFIDKNDTNLDVN